MFDKKKPKDVTDVNALLLEVSIMMLESTLGSMSPSEADRIVTKAVSILKVIK